VGYFEASRGDKMRVFSRLCARFQGWLPMLFFAGKRFFGVCATTFSANRAGICTHIAGQLAHIVGTRRAKKIHCPPLGRGGRSPSYFFLGFLSYATLRPTFFRYFFLK
jgi:hypothetical protein